MASPQKENGYTAIANEVMEKLIKFPFPEKTGLPVRLCLFVIRKTWGFQKKMDTISLTQFERELNSNRPSVVHWLEYLVKAKLLVKGTQLSKNGYGYGFNKDYDQWLWGVKANKLVKVRMFTSKGALTETSKGALTHKRNKEIYTKENNTAEQAPQDIAKVIDSFKEVNPAYKKWFGNKTQRSAVARMLETNSLEKLLKITALLQKTNKMTYAPAIFTPLQLEDKLGQLAAFIQREQNKSPVIL